MVSSTVLGSATVGAVVGAAVSSIALSFNGIAERKSRRRELLLSKAITLAELHNTHMVDYSKTTGKAVMLKPYIVQVRWFHKELKLLYSKEKLSPEIEQQFEGYFREVTPPS